MRSEYTQMRSEYSNWQLKFARTGAKQHTEKTFRKMRIDHTGGLTLSNFEFGAGYIKKRNCSEISLFSLCFVRYATLNKRKWKNIQRKLKAHKKSGLLLLLLRPLIILVQRPKCPDYGTFFARSEHPKIKTTNFFRKISVFPVFFALRSQPSQKKWKLNFPKKC